MSGQETEELEGEGHRDREILLRTRILVATALAHAAQMTVGDLQKICTLPDDSDKNARGLYILGVTEGAILAAGVAGDKGHLCIPPGVPSSAMEFVVRKAIGEDLAFYPADRLLPAVLFIGAALQRQYPCK